MRSNLGRLEGKLLVFGGVYGNFQALQEIHKIATTNQFEPNQIICTGDIAGYCAQPEECVEFIKNWGIHTIAGNVELQLADDADSCGCNFTSGSRCDGFSKNWFPYSKANLSTDSIRWMQNLPLHLCFDYGEFHALVVHGSYHHISEYIFRSTPWEIKQNNFMDAGVNLILAGHCGLPFHDQKNNQYWLNAGVIGMPANDGTNRVWYMILDLEKNKLRFQHHHFTYNSEIAAELMQKNDLPNEYAETLKTGLWDNCEILPATESQEQGKALQFDE